MAMIVGRLGCALSRLLIDQIAGLDSCLPFNELGTHDDDDHDDHDDHDDNDFICEVLAIEGEQAKIIDSVCNHRNHHQYHYEYDPY